MYFILDENLGIYYYITEESDELKEIKVQEVNKKDDHWYECYDIYDDEISVHEKLKLFKKDFTNFNNEIKDLYDINNYHYFDCKNYVSNKYYVLCFFKKYATLKMKQAKIEPIVSIESEYMESTQNGGLQYLGETGVHESYGSDFSGYYMNLLGNKNLDLDIPIKPGKESRYNSVDDLTKLYKSKKLKYGYYKIKITSEHKDVIKVFTFSKKNTYTHISLSFALRYRQLYKFKFEIVDNPTNCYLYEKDAICKSSEIFGEWFHQLKMLKEKLPKNKVVKHISSSLWGFLTQFNRRFVTLDELMEMDDIDNYKIEKHNNDKSISLINKTKMYREDLARIKSFVTAYARDYMGRLIIDEKIHDNIIRIHTDGIVLNIEHNFKNEIYKPIPEAKTTGKIFWVNTNKYYHQCSKCQNFYKYDKRGCPECN
jgi:hypothetical protein